MDAGDGRTLALLVEKAFACLHKRPDEPDAFPNPLAASMLMPDALANVPVDALLYVLDLIGVAVFAVSGALAAGRKHLDLFGVYVLAVVTATGGGTLRDVLLDRHPVFWIADPPSWSSRWPRRARRSRRAVGHAAAAPAAHRRRARARPVRRRGGAGSRGDRVPPLIVVVMGMMTGTFGGVIRDVLTSEIPLILRPGRLYATAAALARPSTSA